MQFDRDDAPAVVERRVLGQHDLWEVPVARSWLRQVDAALAASPFPASDLGHRAPDSVWRTVTANGQRCTVEWRVGIDNPDWAPLFALLDGILWLVCPEYLPGTRPDDLDSNWVGLTDPAAR